MPRRRKLGKAAMRDFTPAVKREVQLRSGYTCEYPRCTRPIECYHHRLRRSQGGMGTVENAMGLCHAHHADVHAFPEHSYANDWLRHPAPVNTGLKR